MSDADALLAAIRAAPDDDAPRLIYADWLEEHGQTERAEFIRIQCELARIDSPTLKQREAELLAEHHNAFAGPLAAPGLGFRFRRGFAVGFGHLGVFESLYRIDANQPLGHYMLRFYPDGTVISIATTGTPEEALVWFRPGHEYTSHGTYTLMSVTFPADIQFSVSDRNGTTAYSGTFDGKRLILDIGLNGQGYRAQHWYTQYPVEDDNTFVEF
jgi:uncharacterized protein (TIGR02996 family)